ncbi:hypothetical protein V501_07647 [Pseudogymnoascus sp. VKM F-4519 (FW-2642)]|nr:hypothetical protein V501_07647 [Pseudogymnoascus sp. VKM F-4519 (FW-2642)]
MAPSPFNPPLTLTTPSHTLILSEGTPADIPSFCTICYDAYATDPMLHATYGTASPAAIIASNIKRWELDWLRPSRHVYKAVDAATGEIVAVAKWVFPHTPTPPPEALAKVGFPEGVNMALLGAFFGRSLEKRERWMEWEDMYRASLFTLEGSLGEIFTERAKGDSADALSRNERPRRSTSISAPGDRTGDAGVCAEAGG